MTRPGLRLGVVLGLMITFLAASAALAQNGDFNEKFRTGDTITIGPQETIGHDLYVAGGTVIVEGTIDGDLVVTGGSVTVVGTVTGDLLAAGGNIDVSGTVEGDARLAGGLLSVGGTIAEDLLLAGGTLSLTESGTVGEDIVLTGGTASLAGDVSGDAIGSVGTYTRTGSVGGTDAVEVGEGAGQAPPVAPTPSDLVLDAIRHYLAVLVVGLLALWLAPRATGTMAAAVRERLLPVIGWGIGGLVGFVVLLIALAVLVLLLAVVLGLLGFGGLAALDVLAGIVAFLGVILAFAFVTGFLADVIVGLALAQLATAGGARFTPGRDRDRGRQILGFAVGAAVVVLLTSVPLVGPWVKLLVVILGLGAFLYALWLRRGSGGRGVGVTAEPVVSS